jgi:hypothetical protein
MKNTVSIALILLISACASTTTDSLVKAEAIKEANEYCKSKNKTTEIIKVTQKDMASSKDAEFDVKFKCVEQS